MKSDRFSSAPRASNHTRLNSLSVNDTDTRWPWRTWEWGLFCGMTATINLTTAGCKVGFHGVRFSPVNGERAEVRWRDVLQGDTIMIGERTAIFIEIVSQTPAGGILLAWDGGSARVFQFDPSTPARVLRSTLASALIDLCSTFSGTRMVPGALRRGAPSAGRALGLEESRQLSSAERAKYHNHRRTRHARKRSGDG